MGLGKSSGTQRGCLSRVLEEAEGQVAPCQCGAHTPLTSFTGLRLKCGCFKRTHPGGLVPRALSAVSQWRLLRKAWYPASRDTLRQLGKAHTSYQENAHLCSGSSALTGGQGGLHGSGAFDVQGCGVGVGMKRLEQMTNIKMSCTKRQPSVWMSTA